MRIPKSVWRVSSALLAAAVLTTSVITGRYVLLADAETVQNYYALDGFVSGGEAPSTAYWHYEAKDFSEPVPFEESAEGFAAPSVTVPADDTTALVAFAGREGADGYRLDIYTVRSGVYSLFGEPLSLTEPAGELTGLTPGSTYAVQAVALREGQELEASEVAVFQARVSQNYVVLNDATQADRTYSKDASAFAGYGVTDYEDSPSGKAYYYTIQDESALSDSSVTGGTAAEKWYLNFDIGTQEPLTDIGGYAIWIDYSALGEKNSFPLNIVRVGNKTGDTNNNKGNTTGFQVVDKGTTPTYWMVDTETGQVYTCTANSGVGYWLGSSSNGGMGFKGYVIFPTSAGEQEDFDWSAFEELTLYRIRTLYKEAANQNFYISEIGAVHDVNAFINAYDTEKSREENYRLPVSTFAVRENGILECNDYDPATNKLTNPEIGTGYTINNTNGERAVRFTLTVCLCALRRRRTACMTWDPPLSRRQTARTAPSITGCCGRMPRAASPSCGPRPAGMKCGPRKGPTISPPTGRHRFPPGNWSRCRQS